LSDKEFDVVFTTDKPIIFAYHGYPLLIHRLTYRRANHHNLHVRGYKEEGTTTTPFDMVVLNDLDRFQIVSDVIDRVPGLSARAAYAPRPSREAHRAQAAHRQVRRRHAGRSRLKMEFGRGRKAPARKISRGLTKDAGARS
jgi:xylulose-5-phosphate/fructose-6-phosphate phosphoketolase